MTESNDMLSAGEASAYGEEYYAALLDHAMTALIERKPFQINADGAYTLIQQAAADRAVLPDLLESLQAICQGHDANLYPAKYEKARAAIAKATAANSVGKSGTDLNQTIDSKDSFFSVAVEVCL